MTDTLMRLSAVLSDRYRVEREVGHGGMATVYLAQDLKHDRKVAVKVLHPELAAALGAERFLAEIRTTAALQHPNILPLFDSGSADGVVYYVMPFVEGESLRERLTREQQLPIDESVRIAQLVAGALDYAHRRGIVHRDIKPENILLSEGQPLVADFGVALAVASAGGTRVTQTGFSVGTPPYMSPEQAAAEREVDRRADIYALGAVLYEMLAGQPPFTGPTAAAITARKMSEPVPQLRNVRDTIPGALETVVRKALARTPADRFATAQQFADALELARTLSGATAITEPATTSVAARTPARQRLPWLVAATAALVAIIATGWAIGGRVQQDQNGDPPPVEFSLSVEPLAVAEHGPAPVVAFSPDGRQLAYVSGPGGDGQLYIRRLDGSDAVAIAGVTRAQGPFFSPDGQWIAYGDATDRTLRKVRVSGGVPVTLCKADDYHGGTWGRRGTIAFSAWEEKKDIGIWSVPEDGGPPKFLAGPDRSKHVEAWYTFPSFLPDGRSVLYSTLGGNAVALNVSVLDIATGNHRVVLDKGGWARYVAPGHLIYAQDGALFGVAFDADAERVTGKPIRIRQNVIMNLPWEMGLGHFDVSSTGTLAYLSGSQYENGGEGLEFADRSGKLAPMPDLGIRKDYLGMHTALRVSPDGKRLLVSGVTGPLENFKGYPVGSALYLYDIARGSLTRLSPDNPGSWFGVWMPDGQRIAEMMSEDSVSAVSLFLMRTDGLGSPERLTRARDGRFEVPWSVSPDGSLLFYFEHSGGSLFDIWAVPLSGNHQPRAILSKPTVDERDPAISPDGHWLAYVTNETGTWEVYLTDFPAMRHRWPVSSGGGTHPAWNSNGRELFFSQAAFVAPFELWSVAVSATAPEPLGKQKLLFRSPSLFNQSISNPFDPLPGGNRFLVMQRKPVERSSIDHLTIVVNWTSELRAAMR